MNIPALLFAGACLISAVTTYWLALETYLLWKGLNPITWYTRNEISWHHGVAVLVVALFSVGLGAGITHFVLDR